MSTPQFDSPAVVPLSAPLYGASPRAAARRFFAKYATFSGRASRSEYWWWYLVSFVVTGVLQILALTTGGAGGVAADGTPESPGVGYWIFTILIIVWGLGTLIPSLAVLVRRLHDSDRSGFFFFLCFVPFVGGIIVLILLAMPTKPEGARFDA